MIASSGDWETNGNVFVNWHFFDNLSLCPEITLATVFLHVLVLLTRAQISVGGWCVNPIPSRRLKLTTPKFTVRQLLISTYSKSMTFSLTQWRRRVRGANEEVEGMSVFLEKLSTSFVPVTFCAPGGNVEVGKSDKDETLSHIFA